MTAFLASLSGYKTYIGLGVAAGVLLLHSAGVVIPGVSVDDSNLGQNLWGLVMAAAGRSALANLIPVVK